MKRSNKLLVALLTITFLGIVGTNMILKGEYDKIDFNDMFYGFSLDEVEPFSVVQLNGNHLGIIQIQKGENFQVRVEKEIKKHVQWQVKDDTLKLNYMPERDPHWLDKGDRFILPASVYVLAPELKAVNSTAVRSRLSGWRGIDLVLEQEGFDSGMYLDNNSIKSVSVHVKKGGMLRIGTNNEIEQMKALVDENSSLEIERDIFECVQLDIDSLARVKLPGTMYKKIGKD